MNADGSLKPTTRVITTVSDLGWQIVGMGRFDEDGIEDLVWRNATSGENAIWYMNADGSLKASTRVITPVRDSNWRIAGVGAFDDDGIEDLVWRNLSVGNTVLWWMRQPS